MFFILTLRTHGGCGSVYLLTHKLSTPPCGLGKAAWWLMEQGVIATVLARAMGMQSVALVAGTQCRFKPGPEELGLDPADFTDVEVNVHVAAEDAACVVILLDASAEARLVCDRTLEAFSARVSGTCRILARYSSGGEAVPPYDEMIVLEPSQRLVDVTRVARDTLVLAIPVRKVAPHAEDIDLQCVFGAPEPKSAPYWGPLRQLKTDS